MKAAIWDFSLTWSLVQPPVAAFTSAATYSRLGLEVLLRINDDLHRIHPGRDGGGRQADYSGD